MFAMYRELASLYLCNGELRQHIDLLVEQTNVECGQHAEKGSETGYTLLLAESHDTTLTSVVRRWESCTSWLKVFVKKLQDEIENLKYEQKLFGAATMYQDTIAKEKQDKDKDEQETKEVLEDVD